MTSRPAQKVAMDPELLEAVDVGGPMQAAGLAWSPRPQGYTLRRRIVMSTELLESLVEIRPEDASPDLLVGDVKRQMELFA